MKPIGETSSLMEQFAQGKTAKDLDGFYNGKLDQLIPGNPLESLGELISHFWLPWLGKTFQKDKQTGDNLMPSYLASLFQNKYASAIIQTDTQTLRAFPFKTQISKGLQDNIPVLQLNYDLTQNPPQLRQVRDELVMLEKDRYLGKAFLLKNNQPRLVAFFSLEKK